MDQIPGVQALVRAVLDGRPVEDSLDIPAFFQLHRELVRLNPGKELIPVIVVYSDSKRNAAATYPQISATRLSLVSEKPITQTSLEISIGEVEILGDVLPSSLASRLREEAGFFVRAGLVAVLTAGVFAAISSGAARDYGDYLAQPDIFPLVSQVLDLYVLVGQSVVTVMGLFLSIYVLFSVAQTSSISEDGYLFRVGLFHKYVRDERYILKVATTSLVLAFIGLIATAAPTDLFQVQIAQFTLNKINVVIPIVYAIAIFAGILAFWSLAYFSGRAVTAREAKMLDATLKLVSGRTGKVQHPGNGSSQQSKGTVTPPNQVSPGPPTEGQ